MEENAFAGNAMKRRSNFQYGLLLEKGETGSLSVGIGLTTSNGTTAYMSPTFEVTDDLFETTVDGVKMIFQLTPGTESPAEMNTYLPEYKALWMAENCTGTMHNIYTLRGAEIRDAEVILQSHNWLQWGKEVINEYLLNTAAVYKFIHTQTLQYINEGYTKTEIAHKIGLPDDLEKVWYTRQYYGTLKHNVKAVYQKYMGWYDANPIHLDELEPSEYAQKLMEYLGSTDKVLEQLGYQAESGAWRNAYLNAAYELRHGTDDYPDTSVGGTGAYTLGMSTETMLDYLGISMDAKAMEKENLVINMEVIDENTKYLLTIHNGVLLYSKESWSDNSDATIRTSRTGILGIALNNQKLMDASIESVSGDEDVLKILAGNLAEFNPYFNIIEP